MINIYVQVIMIVSYYINHLFTHVTFAITLN